ncbi:hypothetical protein [Bacteroides pyogenes]|uniref:hypothetical protein n=1 Tax=Bacteroides pyogenes TaxID=310300 RepID=UPI002FDA74DA
MQIVESIKFEGRNLTEVFKLECVERIIKLDDNSPHVYLSPKFTDGRRYLRKGEYLVKFANGMWQVFGAEAYQKLNKKGKE